MRRRLYFLLPDPASARGMMDDLLLARIEERHIHFLARRGTPMDGLHEASHLQKSDLVHGAQVGLALGTVLGLIVGALLVNLLVTADRWQIVTVLGAGVTEVRENLRLRHPEAEDRGIDPHIPAFP
ncbi:MAG: DUF1269 domain-containing protein [Casimicrobiaceae bacterium]